MSDFIIELKELQFFSFHGLYEEEKKAGGEFVVDLFASFSAKKPITDLDQTINYATLYALVKEEMSDSRELLETLAESIAEKIYLVYPILKKIDIRIEKKNPPIVGFSGRVAIHYRKEY